MRKNQRSAGYTVIELLATILIASILLLSAVPSFSQIANTIRLNTEVDVFYTSVLLARSEALKRNARVVMCKSVSGEACSATGGWEQGWLVFHDGNNNAQLDNGEKIVWRQQALQSSMRLTGNTPVAKYVSYSATGTSNLVSGAFQAGTITLCKQSNGASPAWRVVINSSGHARTVRTTVAQCV